MRIDVGVDVVKQSQVHREKTSTKESTRDICCTECGRACDSVCTEPLVLLNRVGV